ncbi:hypothetical protein P152DRAFT_461662 [Eremomyces bilateralis CBS 781.70]|uniref:Uncharacterized protein n=1 Tax=Eremomyces bilateralis CBS 781.70 TaxID=1392243 RepID=A0A6G1FU97_9PEZI|nr:uncharacterized protein P152DRAFT_461662 [Eremomyces bilateralis CBS 781.70]KAF1809239.1 hypothetical protein P152DRAFT_461662 [Eremomyces bilateralis CBS 781.70]
MSHIKASPTARLLRSSRLFSLPPPLPAPSMLRTTSMGLPRESDTATLPYPTIQAIATPASSRARGDWGLKRPLPLQSTTVSSTPEIKVTAMDTLEHVTDFQGATDHTQTLRKFQQMSVPMLGYNRTPRFLTERSAARPSFRSAFEEEDDNTYIENTTEQSTESGQEGGNSSGPANTSTGLQALQARKKWKYQGPWLGGMTPSDFNLWVKDMLKYKKDGFQQLLREHIVDKMWTDRVDNARKAAVEAHSDDPLFDVSSVNLEDHYPVEPDGRHFTSREKFVSALEPVLPKDITTAPIIDALAIEFHAHIRSLRRLLLADPQLSALLQEVLHLPPLDRDFNDSPSLFDSYNLSSPPLSTHPSAGLSYLRTNAHMTNHPLVGPRAAAPPVRGRILAPSSTQRGRKAKLGIGGFVVQEEGDARTMQPNKSMYMKPDEFGGKMWANVEAAEVDSKGRVNLKYHAVADKADEVNVKQGVYERQDIGERVEKRASFARAFL